MFSDALKVTGANTATVSSGGSALIGPSSRATFSSSAQAFVQSGALDVSLLDGATGTVGT